MTDQPAGTARSEARSEAGSDDDRRQPSGAPRIGSWQPVAEGVYRLIAEPAAVNIGLVVGAEAALLIDTGSTPAQGAEIRSSIAEVTDRPLVAVVVTHSHFDHAFGLAAFADLESIGHESLAESLTGPAAAAAARDLGLDPAELAQPRSGIGVADAVDLGGGRVAEITHLGVGHTRGDLVVAVTDPVIQGFPGVIFAGDLVESAVAPWFGPDSSPDQWSWAVDRLLNLARPGTIVVPGHGDPVDRDFVREQRDALDGVRMEIERLARSGVPEAEALAAGEWPFPAEHIAAGIAAGYAEVRAVAPEQSGTGGRPTLPLA